MVYVHNLAPLLIAVLGLLWAQTLYAATFTVTKTADTADGTCDADCSLREAVIAANANAGADDITLPAGTYLLDIDPNGAGEDASARGDLDITDELILSGAGAATTIIDGAGIDRVIEMPGNTTVEISGVTIQNGDAGSRDGGGIRNRNGVLKLTDCVIRDNKVPFGCSGGMYFNGDALIMRNTIITRNQASEVGGLLFETRGVESTIVNSTVSENTATSIGGIGVSLGDSGKLTITNSTISGNVAEEFVAGIYADVSGGTLSLVNSTISGNTLAGNGCVATFDVSEGEAKLINCTVTDNTAEEVGTCTIEIFGRVVLDSTIIAGNSPSEAECFDGGANLVSLGHNIASDSSCNLTDPTDLPNTTVALGPLQDNGGPTETHALLSSGSVAVDAAGNLDCTLTDQRGRLRADGDGDGSIACDIGAFEFDGDPVAPPLPLDHFKCWQVKDLKDPKFAKTTVELNDQFAVENVEVKKPFLICAPADKDGSGISDPETHLCCYKIKGSGVLQNVRIVDQFGPLLLEVKKGKFLCQPCTKTVVP